MAYCPLEPCIDFTANANPSYGINGQLANEATPGKYKLFELNPRVIFFTDTDITKVNGYVSGFSTTAYRHRDKANVLYANGMVRGETKQTLGTDSTRWAQYLPTP